MIIVMLNLGMKRNYILDNKVLNKLLVLKI